MKIILIIFLSFIITPLWSASAVCSQAGTLRNSNACMPVVFVIRHAEDTTSGPHALTEEGQKHAELYVKFFENFIWGDAHHVGIDKSLACVCPIGKIISISEKGGEVIPRNPNPNPSPNPYDTVKNLSENLNISITTDNGQSQYWSSFQWNKEAKKNLFDNKGNSALYSVVISWDKQGLNPTEEDYNKLIGWLRAPESTVPFNDFIPLLKNFPATLPNSASISLLPLRTNLWLYSDQNDEGKFKILKFYQQTFVESECETGLKTGMSQTPTSSSKCLIATQVNY